MQLQPEQTIPLIASLIGLNVIGIIAFAVVTKMKKRREKRRLRDITAALIDYFHKTGVEVSAGCTVLMGSHSYSAVIESEPMKRFRLSHIIEIALREHVRKACGLELGNVYWRFPIKDTPTGMAAAGAGNGDTKPVEKPDEYINEGLEQYKYIPKVEVTEMSWENFTEAATSAPAAASESTTHTSASGKGGDARQAQV